MTPAGHNELADLLIEFARTMLTDFRFSGSSISWSDASST